jgi:hypothetical protein
MPNLGLAHLGALLIVLFFVATGVISAWRGEL